MIQFELTESIARPRQIIFAFLKDFRNAPLWNYYVMKVEKADPDDITIGSVFIQTRKHDVNSYVLTELIPEQSITIELQPPAPKLQLRFVLNEDNSRTRVVYRWKLDLNEYKLLRFIPAGAIKNWLLGFAKRFIMKRVKPAVEQNFGKLKTLLETGQVTLQDGRIMKLPITVFPGYQ